MRRNVRHIEKLDDLVQARALDSQLRTRFKHPHPFLHHLGRIPNLEVLYDMNRPCFISIVVRERKLPKIGLHVRKDRSAFVRDATFCGAFAAVYCEVNADPSFFVFVPRPKIEANRSAHRDPIDCGLKRPRM